MFQSDVKLSLKLNFVIFENSINYKSIYFENFNFSVINDSSKMMHLNANANDDFVGKFVLIITNFNV